VRGPHEHVTERDHLRTIFIEVTNAELPATPFGKTTGPASVDDSQLVARIIAAYQASIAIPAEVSESFWDGVFAEQRRDVHKALVMGDTDAVQGLLHDPGKTDLFYGFESLARSLAGAKQAQEPWSTKIYQDLLLLAEAIGVRRTWNPESPKSISPLPHADDLLALIDRALGLPCLSKSISRRDWIGDIAGSHHVSDRSGALSAWRVFALVNGDCDARVLEIGAGLGRTAFYARQFGLRKLHDRRLADDSRGPGLFSWPNSQS
jgi:hypothetical protein